MPPLPSAVAADAAAPLGKSLARTLLRQHNLAAAVAAKAVAVAAIVAFVAVAEAAVGIAPEAPDLSSMQRHRPEQKMEVAVVAEGTVVRMCGAAFAVMVGMGFEGIARLMSAVA